MLYDEIKFKLFIAGLDVNSDTFLENEVEKWRVSSIDARVIQSVTVSLTSKELVAVILYKVLKRSPGDRTKHLDYLKENQRKIYGRNLESEEFEAMGFPNEWL